MKLDELKSYRQRLLAVGGLFVTLGLTVAGWKQRTRIHNLIEEL